MSPPFKFVWSHSALDEYDSCPHKFWRKRVVKNISDPPGPEAQIGTDIHKALEDNIAKGTPIPPSMPSYAKQAELVHALPGEKFAELKLGLTVDLRGCDFFSPEAWGRAVVDVLVRPPKQHLALVVDWKTGKPPRAGYPSHQASRNAVAIFANYPEVERVGTSFRYVQHNVNVNKVFERVNLAAILHPTYQTLGNVSWSIEHDNWPKRPSGLCKNWCPVFDCEHNGRRK